TVGVADSKIKWTAEDREFDKPAYLYDDDDVRIAVVEKSTLWQLSYVEIRSLAQWLPPKDSCDLRTVRLKHLDGSPVELAEYDRMQRFLRLWRKLGWSIDETDRALIGLAAASNGSGETPSPG